MALIDVVIQQSDRNYKTALWEAVGEDDVGQAIAYGQFPEKTLQISGTAGGASTIELQGSMDGTTWFTLTSDGSTAIGGATGLFYVWENPKLIRPHTVGGTGTDLDFILGMPTLI